jgi:hypothetical protein
VSDPCCTNAAREFAGHYNPLSGLK